MMNSIKDLVVSIAVAVSCVLASGVAHANFLLSVDPADLQFNGAGAHSVDLRVTHSAPGASTISGYTIRFGSAANANLGVLPAGVTATSATIGLPLPATVLFNLNMATNTVAGSSLGGDADVGNLATATLFTLNLNLGNATSYVIGVDFQNAQRGGLFATDISNEFDPNSPTTDFTFTLQNTVAVPEPSSLSLLVGAIGIAAWNRRRRQSV